MRVQKIKLTNSLKTTLSGVVFILFYIIAIYNNNVTNLNFLTTALFLLLASYSFVRLSISIFNNSYSLDMMHWFFIFIFYGIAAFIQYMNSSFVYLYSVPDNKLQLTLLSVIIWVAMYELGRIKFLNKGKENIIIRTFNKQLLYSNSFIVVSTIISVLILAYLVSQTGISSLFSRSTAGEAFMQSSKADTLLVMHLLRNFVVYGFTISYLIYKKNKKHLFCLIILAISVLIINSPFGMARYNVAIIYIGLLLILFPKLKRNKFFIVFLFVGIIVIFPVINLFRVYSINDINLNLTTEALGNIVINFNRGDYDAFSMVVNTWDYVRTNGITYGKQFLGTLLFFVSRSIWSSKPIGSGHTVRISQGETFTNVSSPLVAESIMNFGWLGIILFGIFIGKVVRKIDSSYWSASQNESSRYIDIIYPFLLSMFFFMNRGDLLSSFSYSCGHIIVFSLMFFINNRVLSKLIL